MFREAELGVGVPNHCIEQDLPLQELNNCRAWMRVKMGIKMSPGVMMHRIHSDSKKLEQGK